MNLNKTEYLLRTEFIEYNKTPIWILNKKKELMESYFYENASGVKEKLFTHIRRIVEKSVEMFQIFYYEKELYYCFSYERKEEQGTVVGGPILLSPIYPWTEAKKLSFSKELSTKELQSLLEYLPVLSFSTFSASLRIMMLLCGCHALSEEEIRNFQCTNIESTVQYMLTHELFDHKEEIIAHTSYQQELALLHCVEEGSVMKLQSVYKTLPETKYGNMSNNPLKKLFYGCIANTTLVTRYAIVGGLEEEVAFTLSDIYIKKMEKCKSLYELNVLNEKMALDFTQRVAKVKKMSQAKYSKPIAKCIQYISNHLHYKLTLQLLSEEVNLTPKYLSWLFIKETGKKLSVFIEEEKIREAKTLLLYSEYSYSKISQSLSFSSQSYFIATFKKLEGVTPKQFRERHALVTP